MVDRSDRLYPHALRFKAKILSIQGKQQEALSIAADGKRLYPGAPIFYILEASLLRQEEDYLGAEHTLKQGLAQLKNDPELTYELALVYEVLERRDEGLALMESVVRAHPDHANALNYVGYTLAEEGRDLDRALVLVTKASSLDPENGYILDSVAWVHFRKNELKKAWEYIRYAVDLVDTDPTIWEHYGDIAAAMGKKAEARKGYSLSLKFNAPKPEVVRGKLEGPVMASFPADLYGVVAGRRLPARRDRLYAQDPARNRASHPQGGLEGLSRPLLRSAVRPGRKGQGVPLLFADSAAQADQPHPDDPVGADFGGSMRMDVSASIGKLLAHIREERRRPARLLPFGQ